MTYDWPIFSGHAYSQDEEPSLLELPVHEVIDADAVTGKKRDRC